MPFGSPGHSTMSSKSGKKNLAGPKMSRLEPRVSGRETRKKMLRAKIFRRILASRRPFREAKRDRIARKIMLQDRSPSDLYRGDFFAEVHLKENSNCAEGKRKSRQ